MCFITVTAATVLVNVVYHSVTNATVTVIVLFHGNVTTVITEGSAENFDPVR